MKIKFLVTAALLFASVSLASAQEVRSGTSKGQAVSQNGTGVLRSESMDQVHKKEFKKGTRAEGLSDTESDHEVREELNTRRAGTHADVGGSIAGVAFLRDDIRVVQQILIEHGLLHGNADGIFGPLTHEAIIAFQRQQGMEATGSIDMSTVSSLGVFDRLGLQAQQSLGQSQASSSDTQTSMSQEQSVAPVDLLHDDIRLIQRVLIERKLLHGEADGVLGPETREAIRAFQRQQNNRVTGSIDVQTILSLDVSDQLSQRAKQSIAQSRLSSTRTQPSVKDQEHGGDEEALTEPHPEQQNAIGHVSDQTTGQTAGLAQPTNSTANQIVSNPPNTIGQVLPTRSGIKPTTDQRSPSHALSFTLTGAAIGFIVLALGAFILMPIV
jgi:peptidoglycan hydrolase-like protein with peptidoglycan-binding domain